MDTSSRKIWEKPWGYKEGSIIAAGLAFAGGILQITAGNIQPQLFAYPVNLIIGILFVVGLLFSYFVFRKRSIIRFFGSVYATLPALGMMVVLIIVMGILPQYVGQASDSSDVIARLGWHTVTTSWSFILLSFYNLFILGVAILRKFSQPFEWKHIGFYLNHLGLFLAYLGGILGNADIERLTMTVQQGSVEWRAKTQDNAIKELPIAIQLDTFKIEEYHPKIAIISNETGKILPANKPESYMFEKVGETTRLAGYTVQVVDYIKEAGMVHEGDVVNYAPIRMEGAVTALKIRVTHPNLEKPVEGWISNGSFLFPHHALFLDEKCSAVMPMQEVKKYISHVTVFTQKGDSQRAVIEVNKPFSIEGWTIYMYSYDESKGKYSDTGVFELVRDPWIKVVYTGFFMLIAGALYLFIVGAKRREE